MWVIEIVPKIIAELHPTRLTGGSQPCFTVTNPQVVKTRRTVRKYNPGHAAVRRFLLPGGAAHLGQAVHRQHHLRYSEDPGGANHTKSKEQ